MRTILAFLNKELLITMRMEKKQIGFLFLGVLIMPFIINLNDTALAVGVQYSPEVREVLAMLFVAFVPLMISAEITTQSMLTERRDNMTEFIYCQGINKVTLIISKICLPFILSMVGLLVSTFLYAVFAEPTTNLNVVFSILLMGIGTSLVTILISMSMFFFVDVPEMYTLVCSTGSMIYIAVIAFVSNFATNYLLNSSLLFAVICIVSVVVLFILTYNLLTKKEAVLHFENTK